MDQADLARRRLVVFDFDGTLADTAPVIARTAREVLRGMGLPEERLVDVPKLVGPPFPQAFMMVFGMDRAQAEEATARYRAIYNNLGPAAWPPIPGMPRLVAELHDSRRLVAVASSKAQTTLGRAVADCGMADSLDVVVGRDVVRETTKADGIRQVLARLAVAPGDAVMVGDRCFDVEGAAECGLPCVGVTFGNTAPASELWEAGAVAVTDSVDDLRAALLA